MPNSKKLLPEPDPPLVYFFGPEVVTSVADATRLMSSITLGYLSVRPTDHPFHLTVSGGLIPHFRFWHSEVDCDVRYEVDYDLKQKALLFEEMQVVYFPGLGRIMSETCDGTFAAEGRQGMNLKSDRILSTHAFAGGSGTGFTVSRPALLQRLATLLDAPVNRPLTFATSFDTTQSNCMAVADIISAVTRSKALARSLVESPWAAARLSSMMLDLVLQSLPHTYSEELKSPRKRIAPRHVKRALDYVESHAQSLYSIDDLAEVCGVSVRSLQYGFKQFLDMSPADYVREVRLKHARRAIIAESSRTLTDIAKQWGFTNLTRFKAQFKAAYGETPLELRRRKTGRLEQDEFKPSSSSPRRAGRASA